MWAGIACFTVLHLWHFNDESVRQQLIAESINAYHFSLAAFSSGHLYEVSIVFMVHGY